MKLGVLVDSGGVSEWLGSALQALRAIPELRLEALFLLPRAEAHTGRPAPWVVRKFLAWCQARTGDPFRLSPQSSPEMRRYQLSPVDRNGIRSADRELIASLQLDLLLAAPALPLEGGCTGLARLGVWSLCFGELEFARYRPAYWREVYEDRPVSRLFLLRHTERFERGHVLEEFSAPTERSLCFTKSQAIPAEAAAGFLGRNLVEASASAHPTRVRDHGVWDGTNLPGWPTTAQTLSFAARKLIRSAYLRAGLRGRRLRWIVGIRPFRSDWDLSSPAAGAPFREIVAPPGHYYADPFVIESGSRHWLFFEDWVDALNRGRLACAEIRDDGSAGAPVVILEKPYHLSYPHVFRHGRDFFLIPETSADATVQLYRATKFPFEWKLESILMDRMELVDTTAFHSDGTWYFFTTTTQQPQETYLFTASRLDGTWQYHPANPISSDVQRLRGAGALFLNRGRLVRPAQDCSRSYGYAVRFNEIRRLTPTEYEENPAGILLPTWSPGLLGAHTFNADSRYAVVDGNRLMR